MAYSKTNWQNLPSTSTPLNSTNLNKTEQGVYDNSLITDAVVNKLNPTSTDIYKTATITTGQVTNAIGMSDVIIKGQTTQAVTPTLGSPINVNVVSGSNLINIYNNQTLGKELRLDLPIENLIGNTFNQGTIDFGSSGGTTEAANRINTDYIAVMPNTTYTIANYNTNIYQFGAGLYKYNKVYDSDHKINSGAWVNFPYTFTTRSDTYFVRFAFKNEENTNLSPTGDYKIMFNRGSLSNAYTASGTEPIELCKIGNYQDYFYKDKSKWYLHKEIGKVTLNGTENWSLRNQGDGSTTISFTHLMSNIAAYSAIFCNRCGLSTSSMDGVEGIGVSSQLTDINLEIKRSRLSSLDVQGLKSWLANNNMILYYIANAKDILITDINLIYQLELIRKAPLYAQTNITQTNNNLPMILDITACVDNINGIKAYLRS